MTPARPPLLLPLLPAFTLLLWQGCQEAGQDAPPPSSSDLVSWTDPPFTWQLRYNGSPPGLTASPGGRWTLAFEGEVDLSEHHPRYGEFTAIIVALGSHRQYDGQGNYQAGGSSTALSSNFTTAGVPVEYFDGWPLHGKLHGSHGSPFEAVMEFPLAARQPVAQVHQLKGRLQVLLPADTPPGYYRPRINLMVRVRGVNAPVHLAAFADNWNETRNPYLPLVAVGRPGRPRMPWSILPQLKFRGRSGVLPDEQRGKVALVPRSGFSSTFIVRPGRHDVTPAFPSIFPKGNMPVIAGGDAVIPEEVHNNLDFRKGAVSGQVSGPAGTARLDRRSLAGQGSLGPLLQGGPLMVDMTRTGRYTVTLRGHIMDKFGRRFDGGGTYTVFAANTLTFSTSCKPGNSFLVGDRYPSKVLIHPPFSAEVTVEVDYYPRSDPTRKVKWRASGRANRFGHFTAGAGVSPLSFDEPGEYISHVTARYTDLRGRLWMGHQGSTGVIAPREPEVLLHGTRSFPRGLLPNKAHNGGKRRFSGRPDMTTSFMPVAPTMLPDPYLPYDPRDTLFIPTGGYNESLVEPHFSIAPRDPALASRLMKAHKVRSFLVPPMHQPAAGKWIYLQDVMLLSTDSGGWFQADPSNADELPVLPVSSRGWHPFAFPQFNSVDAYTIMGVIRPGFPVMTSAFQRDAIGLYWQAGHNMFGHHLNNGPNGDLPGDMYRVLGGVVLKDRSSGRSYYDAYSAAIIVTAQDGDTTAISPPGAQALASRGGRDYRLFIGIDTHFALEVGEKLALGGMVFPAVKADVIWTVTTPDGRVVKVKAKADRLGIARGSPAVPVDMPGLYRVKADVRHGKLRGDIVFTADGSYWICALPSDNPKLLESSLGPVTRVDPFAGLRIPVSWPARLKDARLHWGMVTPGQVLDQGEVRVTGGRFEYPVVPSQLTVQFPNIDARDLGNGRWQLADTLVLQFFLEATDGDKKVFDALRLVLRGDKLLNMAALAGGMPGHDTHGGEHPSPGEGHAPIKGPPGYVH